MLRRTLHWPLACTWLQVRQGAGLLLKNNLLHQYGALPEEYRTYIKVSICRQLSPGQEGKGQHVRRHTRRSGQQRGQAHPAQRPSASTLNVSTSTLHGCPTQAVRAKAATCSFSPSCPHPLPPYPFPSRMRWCGCLRTPRGRCATQPAPSPQPSSSRVACQPGRSWWGQCRSACSPAMSMHVMVASARCTR